MLALACACLLAQVSGRLLERGQHRPGEPYGEAQKQTLADINAQPERYEKAHVVVTGRLGAIAMGRYYDLTEGPARVLLLLGFGLDAHELDRFLGGPVELRGIVRKIHPKEYVAGKDTDAVEDPDLPVLPAPSPLLPAVSITVLSFADASDREGMGAAAEPVRDITAHPERYLGKTVRLVGLFRGRNLFADLPAASQRDPSDWVLKLGDSAIWVTGKQPQGKGFSLDLEYRADTVRWLEVAGKPEVVGGIVYLHASKVGLAPRPGLGGGERR